MNLRLHTRAFKTIELPVPLSARLWTPPELKGFRALRSCMMSTAHLLRPLYFKILDPPLIINVGFSRQCRRAMLRQSGQKLEGKNEVALFPALISLTERF